MVLFLGADQGSTEVTLSWAGTTCQGIDVFPCVRTKRGRGENLLCLASSLVERRRRCGSSWAEQWATLMSMTERFERGRVRMRSFPRLGTTKDNGLQQCFCSSRYRVGGSAIGRAAGGTADDRRFVVLEVIRHHLEPSGLCASVGPYAARDDCDASSFILRCTSAPNARRSTRSASRGNRSCSSSATCSVTISSNSTSSSR